MQHSHIIPLTASLSCLIMLDRSSELLPIADLHCDLLSFLSRSSENTPFDSSVRCSIPQLKKGNVKLQVFAIFVETGPGSSAKGSLQAEIFKKLPLHYPEFFQKLSAREAISEFSSSKINILAAIENSSAFCEDHDAIDQVFMQLERLICKIGKPAYISLTWNSENRFGGGASTTVGLKEDGKKLLELLSRKKIPLDLSHACDRLGFEVLNFLDKENLPLPLLASHSNLRSVTDVPRNLPDDLAKEIINRKGLIGLNFFRPFLSSSLEEGDAAHQIFQHLEKILCLNGARHMCFGADFFHDEDLSPKYRLSGTPLFFSSCSNSSCYPDLLSCFKERYALSSHLLKNIAYQNLVSFLCGII